MKKILNLIFDQHVNIIRVLMILLGSLLLVSVMPKGSKFKYDFNKSKPWLHDDLIAPFDFPILKSIEELLDEEKEIKLGAPFYYNHNKSIIEIKEEELQNILTNDKFLLEGEKILKKVFEKGIIEARNYLKDDRALYVLKEDDTYITMAFSDFFTVKMASEYISSYKYSSTKSKKVLAPVLNSLLEHNVVFNKLLTDKEMNDQIANVALKKGVVQYGELIVAKGENVDDQTFQKLSSLKSVFENQSTTKRRRNLATIGYTILCTMLISLLVLVVNNKREFLFNNNSKLLLVLLNVTLFVFLSSFMIKYFPNYLLLLPFCLLPITLKAFFDDEIALYTHLFTIVLVSLIAPNPLIFFLIQFIGGFVVMLSIKQLFKRSFLFNAVFRLIMAYLLIYLSVVAIQDASFTKVNWLELSLLISSATLTLFSYPLIYVYERLFGLLSEVTLLEMTDTNNPLLKELSEKAPGTFQHSLQVSNIAEAAANNINANSMLVRAGALYHDIGKMTNPLYFIENQSHGINPHNELSFEESAKIIIAHVSDGINLAKKNKIPDLIIDFIRCHHGTSTVHYFYKQYLQAFPENEDSFKKFSYAGPKPFSKETAIVMMADAVEAASRSLTEVTQEIIDKLVDTIVNNQMLNLQFENADITFKEIKSVKKVLKNKLLLANHIRKL